MLETSARRPPALPRPGGFAGPVGLVGCLVGLLLLAATGCSSEEKKKTAPPPSPTPLASLNTASMQVPRIEFCKLVPAEAVRDALGGKPDSDAAYGNGDEEEVGGAGQEVVHEIGCSWSTDAGATARAWVFARPVDAAFARTVIADSRQTKGCRTTRTPAYGDPTLTQTCRLPEGGQRVRHAGLFSQTWLTCEVSVTEPEDVSALRERSDDWCVQVANALNTAR